MHLVPKEDSELDLLWINAIMTGIMIVSCAEVSTGVKMETNVRL